MVKGNVLHKSTREINWRKHHKSIAWKEKWKIDLKGKNNTLPSLIIKNPQEIERLNVTQKS
jgi:hypothetical protein